MFAKGAAMFFADLMAVDRNHSEKSRYSVTCAVLPIFCNWLCTYMAIARVFDAISQKTNHFYALRVTQSTSCYWPTLFLNSPRRAPSLGRRTSSLYFALLLPRRLAFLGVGRQRLALALAPVTDSVSP